MSDTIYFKAGATHYLELENAPTGLAGTLTLRVFRKSDKADAIAATTAGITEYPAGSGHYWKAVDLADGEYTAYWSWGEGSDHNASDDLVVTASGAPAVEIGPLYATPEALREKLGVSAEVLPDAEAEDILERACDLIDDRLGNRPVDEDTGRKVVPEEEDAWRVQKLAKATLEVAVVLYQDPGIESRQRVRSVSGDVATSGPYGPAYGERAESLLSASGLAVRFARATQRRGGRNAAIAQRFSESEP